jgi:hypothetical protein
LSNKNLPPLTSVIAKGLEAGLEFERLMKKLLIHDGSVNGYIFEPSLTHNNKKSSPGNRRAPILSFFSAGALYQKSANHFRRGIRSLAEKRCVKFSLLTNLNTWQYFVPDAF